MTTIGDAKLMEGSLFSGGNCSALVTVTTPDCETPICRLGEAKEILGDLTVRQLIERVVSPNSLLSVQVPMTQLEAETPTALAISELLSAGCEVILEGDGSAPVPLDRPASAIVGAQVGAQGSAFVNLSLEVRATRDGVDAAHERRQMAVPEVVEADICGTAEVETLPAPPVWESPTSDRREVEAPEAVEAEVTLSSEPEAGPEAPERTEPMPVEQIEELYANVAAEEELAAPAPAAPSQQMVAIVAETPPRQPRSTGSGDARKEYIRKSDWLRAQFLPEVQALDFSGLFVGNLGMGVREEQARRTVVLADPSRITEVLLRGNSYRRSGDHAKALICYQELVDMDPGNADFRFLLGKTLIELGQYEQGIEALNRSKELGHEGARKELETAKASIPKTRNPLGFLKFWKQ